MYRFFQERFPDFPPNRFLILMEIVNKFIITCKVIEPIQDELTRHERVALDTEVSNFINNLGACIHNENSNLAPLYMGINVLQGILKDYHFREAARLDNRNDVVI